MEKILEVKNLTAESVKPGCKKKILSDVSFSIGKNSTHILIGPNGSGKSSLAHAIMGLRFLKIISGKIIFLGEDITKLSADKRAKMGISLAFQDPAYFEGVKVKDFLRVGNRTLDEKKIKEALSLVGLSPDKFFERDIDRTLSGGERKRIEFASVIVMKPKLLILDEPDAGLDVIIYKELYNILDNIKEETNASILLITHREETGILADRATFLCQGEVIFSGGFRETMRKYCHAVERKKLCKKYQNNL